MVRPWVTRHSTESVSSDNRRGWATAIPPAIGGDRGRVGSAPDARAKHDALSSQLHRRRVELMWL